LLRLAKGVLTPTRAAADDMEIIRRLRTWFEPDEFDDILAGVTVAIVSASGPIDNADLAARVHPLLNPRWSINGQLLSVEDVNHAINMSRLQLEALDLIESDWRTWRAGPSARTLLPRATALADMWSRRPAW
jgi:hypothetical protein